MTERIQLAYDEEAAAERAASVLRKGGIILYPTDTLYGLGASLEVSEALEKLYALKGRDSEKKLSYVVSDAVMAARYGKLNETALKFIDAFLPGPLTLIVPGTGGDTFAFRIPKSNFCIQLAATLDHPYSATSANISGMPAESNIDDILTQFGEKATVIDLCVDAGPLKNTQPSTVVDLTDIKPKVIREGALSKEMLLQIL